MKEARHLISEIMDTQGFIIIMSLAAILFLLETKFDLRKRVLNRWRHLIKNIIVGLPAFVMLRFLFLPLLVWIAIENQQLEFGIAYWMGFSGAFASIVAFFALDYLIYVWHRLTHSVPLLWRFHLVHHTDLDLDVTSSIRFHFGELFLSAIFRGASVFITGASPLLVLVYEICFEVATNFHHSNWRINLKFEKWINYIFVTPRMHGLHHSVIKEERNSNWGTIFSFWDRLHRTFTGRLQSPVVIGESEFQNAEDLTVGKLLQLPFRKNIYQEKKRPK